LVEVVSLIDWEGFPPIIASSYNNLTEKGGRLRSNRDVESLSFTAVVWFV
jgi:hypothetical protein